MQKLLAIEWLKIRKYRTFWILVALFLLLLILWNYGINSGVIRLGGRKSINLFNTAYSFPGVWDNIAFWVKFFAGLIAIIIIINVTNEYQFRTNRQNVIDGMSRLQFYHAKWLLVLSLSLVTALFTLLLGTVFGLINSGSFSGYGDHLSAVFYVFLLGLNYSGAALLLSVLIKRSGMTIVIYLLYLYIAEVLLKGTIDYFTNSDLGGLLPTQSSAELIQFPLLDAAKKMVHMESLISNATYTAVAVGWVIIYYFIGRRKLLRSDW